MTRKGDNKAAGNAMIHSVAMEILHSPPHLQAEGEQLRRGEKRLHAEEVVQWEQTLQDGDQELAELEFANGETGRRFAANGAHPDFPPQTSSSYKDYNGEDPHHEGDGSSLMAMGREDSEPASPSEPDGTDMPAGERTDERLNNTDNCEGEASEEGIDTDGDEEDTNLDDQLEGEPT